MWPQVHSRSGKLWVDWIDFTNGPFNGDVAWTKRQNSGDWTTVELEDFTSEEELVYFVRGTIQGQAAPHGAYQQVPPTQTP